MFQSFFSFSLNWFPFSTTAILVVVLWLRDQIHGQTITGNLGDSPSILAEKPLLGEAPFTIAEMVSIIWLTSGSMWGTKTVQL